MSILMSMGFRLDEIDAAAGHINVSSRITVQLSRLVALWKWMKQSRRRDDHGHHHRTLRYRDDETMELLRTIAKGWILRSTLVHQAPLTGYMFKMKSEWQEVDDQFCAT